MRTIADAPRPALPPPPPGAPTPGSAPTAPATPARAPALLDGPRRRAASPVLHRVHSIPPPPLASRSRSPPGRPPRARQHQGPQPADTHISTAITAVTDALHDRRRRQLSAPLLQPTQPPPPACSPAAAYRTAPPPPPPEQPGRGIACGAHRRRRPLLRPLRGPLSLFGHRPDTRRGGEREAGRLAAGGGQWTPPPPARPAEGKRGSRFSLGAPDRSPARGYGA